MTGTGRKRRHSISGPLSDSSGSKRAKVFSFDANTAKRDLVSRLLDIQGGPIRKALLQLLDTKCILNLAWTSKELRYLSYERVFDINALLRRYEVDPVAFRRQMACSEALIFGEPALQFFQSNRSLYERRQCPLTLPVCVMAGEAVESFEEYLTQREKFSLVDRRTCDHKGTQIIGTHRYHKQGPIFGSISITLVVTKSLPVYSVLTSANITALTNFISWNRAISVFPRTSFIDKKAVHLAAPTPHSVRTAARLGLSIDNVRTALSPQEILAAQLRGQQQAPGQQQAHASQQTLVQHLNAAHLQAQQAAQQQVMRQQLAMSQQSQAGQEQVHTRYVGDRHSWVMPLDTYRIPRPEQTPTAAVLECNTFQTWSSERRAADPGWSPQMTWMYRMIDAKKGARHITISAKVYQHPSLKYRYMVPVGPVQPGPGSCLISTGLKEELDDSTRRQLWLLPESDFLQIMQSQFEAYKTAPDTLKVEQKPAGWEYHDEKFILYILAKVKDKVASYELLPPRG